jgi:protein transport protein SEC61 subunit gamma and related proteins
MEFKIKERLENYKRILMVTKKPSWSEFSFVTKICAIGTLIIGVIGLTLYLIAVLIGL